MTVVAAACRVGADVVAGVEGVLVNLADDAVVAVLAGAGKGVVAVHAQPAIQTRVAVALVDVVLADQPGVTCKAAIHSGH